MAAGAHDRNALWVNAQSDVMYRKLGGRGASGRGGAAICQQGDRWWWWWET